MFTLKMGNENNLTIYILMLAKIYCERYLNIVNKLDW